MREIGTICQIGVISKHVALQNSECPCLILSVFGESKSSREKGQNTLKCAIL